MANHNDSEPDNKKRAYVSQTEIPRFTVTEAVKVARAISDSYAKAPTKPLRVAEALRIAPTTGGFRNLTSASAAYQLTEGAAFANEISLTDIGRRAVAPTSEGADRQALREALMKPRVVREFLMRYDDSKMPTEAIGMNVLEEMGLPREACQRAFAIIDRNVSELGLIREINGQRFVDLQGTSAGGSKGGGREVDAITLLDIDEDAAAGIVDEAAPTAGPNQSVSRKVFITHGSNKEVLQQLKELLTFGDFEPVIAVERDSVAKPVSDKVLDDMRLCSAGIVHVGSEKILFDEDGKPEPVLNSNVLIEIGAAMALYGRRFILLVEKGVSLPSNLEGLYEVRYEGSKLDYESTMKLLKAFNDFKS
jgi:predicted nucleotide-binding protein